MLLPRYERRLMLANWGLHATGVAAVCLIGLIGWFVANLFNRQIASYETHADLARMFLEGAEKIIERQQAIQLRLATLKSENETLLAKIPELPQEAECLGMLTQFAQQHGVELNEFRPGPHMARDNYSEFDIQLSGGGSYEAVCRFLAGLEGLPRLCKLGDLRLSNADELGEECQIELRLIVPFDIRANNAAIAENKP